MRRVGAGVYMVEFLDWQMGLMAMGLGCTAAWAFSMARLVRLSERGPASGANQHRDIGRAVIEVAGEAGPPDAAVSCVETAQQAALPKMAELAQLRQQVEEVRLRDPVFEAPDFAQQIRDFTKDADFSALSVLSQYRQSINALEEESARRKRLAGTSSLVTLPEHWSLIPAPNKA